ncbi:CaiB/BaiF CoA-transferase family protein [Curvibacter sp. RS43]|uniref:CaiB/BaiF CoA transferase family protein n=1 Tax=Curvibacter microcysteis TaxID=3026419 RepID=UPI00236057C3|nr:CaiB/BaiF CoA-transferase family protein [Curvibacter sp. RS43]MDD0812961.1 CaiB/BaiF CoA-transferase family protein [Curvibacter sp. RS43]
MHQPQAQSTVHQPLAGVRVLEMAQIMAGPTCGMMLADLGAEVIKIEKFPGGDDARQYQKPGDSAMPPSFRMINRGKRSLAVDIRTPAGKAIIQRLAGQCDVLTENFRIGVMERLGLGYQDLRHLNPGLIYCSITGYGRVGPLASKGGFDLILQAFSGLISATGEPDGPPVKPGVSIADTNAGILAALAIVSAYVHRLKTGQGQHVETSLLQASLQQTYWLAANYFSSGLETPRLGTAHSLIAPYQVFKTRDGGMVIGGGNPKAWISICEVLGHPEWSADPRFDHPQKRVQNRQPLEALINQVLAQEDTTTWCSRFDMAGVPAGPLNTAGQALEHEQSRAVGMVVDVPDGLGGTSRGLGSPLTFSGRSEVASTPAPHIGEHSREVLVELGYGESEVDALIEAKVVLQS